MKRAEIRALRQLAMGSAGSIRHEHEVPQRICGREPGYGAMTECRMAKEEGVWLSDR